MRGKNLTDSERLEVLEEMRLARYYRPSLIAKRRGITRTALYMLEMRERRKKNSPPPRSWMTGLA